MEGYHTKILLAVPPKIEDLEIYKLAGVRAPPLGLAYIAAVLENSGHVVSIIDSPTLLLTIKEFIRKVKQFKPDIVGLTAITPTVYKAYYTAKAVKEIYPDIPIIMGGPHVTFMYDEALSQQGVDIVILGEGEHTTLELIETIERFGLKADNLKKVRGIAYKHGDNIIVTRRRALIKDLNKLPDPARHLLPMDKYTFLDKPIKVFHLMASRGCPYGCIYCSTSYFWGRFVRFKSVNRVINEIINAIYRYKTNYIVFVDDELTINKKWIMDFCRKIREERLDIYYTVGSRVDMGTIDVLKALKKSGCGLIYYGVESANQNSLNKIGKHISIPMIRRAFENAKKMGLDTVGSFILGFPWETVDDMKETINFAIKIKPSFAQFTVLTPYPGTPIYYSALKEGLIEDFNWENYTTLKAVMKGYNFTRNILQKMLSYAYKKFYIRFSYLIDLIKRKRFNILINILKKEVIPWFMSIFRRE